MKKTIKNIFILLLVFINFHFTYSQSKSDNSSKMLKLERKKLGDNINRLMACSIGEVNKILSNINEDDISRIAERINDKVICKIKDNESLEVNINDQQNDYHFNVEKSKKINKSFKVSSTTRLDLENKFGKVHITTWDKNEISVDINIIAKANTEEKAQDILNKINVDIKESVESVLLRTQMESINSKGKNDNRSFEINYTINMPKNNPLKVRNSFGDMFLGNFNGKTDIEVKYGGLRAEKLSSNENNIKVAFGSGSITYVKTGKLDISYSDFNLGSGGNINLTSSFSDVQIDSIDDLDIKNKYGKVEIGSVNSVSGANSFADFKLKKLTTGLDMKIQYCGDFEVRNIAKNFKQINIDGGFSHFDLTFGEGSGFNFDVNVSFGNADIDRNKAQFNISEKKNTSAYYKGRFGKGNGQGSVIIKSNYGDINLDSTDN